MHAGHDDKKSKTELIFILSTCTLSRWRNQHSTMHETVDELTNAATLKPQKVKIKLDVKCDEAEETRRVVSDHRGGFLILRKYLNVLDHACLFYWMTLLMQSV